MLSASVDVAVVRASLLVSAPSNLPLASSIACVSLEFFKSR